MAIIAHLKDEYTGLKSTAFLSVEEINMLVQFLIGVGTRAEMENAYGLQCGSQPTPQEYVKKLDGKIDPNSLTFTPTIRRFWCDTGDIFNMHHNFELDGTRRKLLGGYRFGKYGEVYDKGGEPVYDDLQIFIGGRQVFDSTSHEYYAAADLDGLEEKFIASGNSEVNREIVRKLNYAKPPEFIIGTTAQVILNGDSLAVETADGASVVFEFCADDNEITFNTGYLGGTPKYVDGNVVLIGASPCDFLSGKTYVIDDFTFATDVQGVAKLKKGSPTFCSLYIELTDKDGKHCDIEIDSPYIYAIEK